MNKNAMNANSSDMVITKVFNAPKELVWEAWSSGEWVKKWWGPMGFSAPVAEIDFRKNGISLVCMRSPDGYDIFNTWTYTAILPYERIEFTQHFCDKDRKILAPASIGLPAGIPDAVPHIITFKDLGNGQVEMTVVESGYTSIQAVEMSKAGMSQVLDKMEIALKAAK